MLIKSSIVCIVTQTEPKGFNLPVFHDPELPPQPHQAVVALDAPVVHAAPADIK
jgi:hypothetical protein